MRSLRLKNYRLGASVDIPMEYVVIGTPGTEAGYDNLDRVARGGYNLGGHTGIGK